MNACGRFPTQLYPEVAKGHAGASHYRPIALLCLWFSMREQLEVFGFLLLVPESVLPPSFKIIVFYSIYLILCISAVALVATPSGHF